MRNLPLLPAAVLSIASLQAGGTRVPSIDQLIELRRPGSVAMAPDGTRIAFTVTETNWDENAYETEIFAVAAGGALGALLVEVMEAGDDSSARATGAQCASHSNTATKGIWAQ